MKRLFLSILLVFGLLGCAGGLTTQSSPEAQIAAGANSLTAATTLAMTLLRNDKITVAQAKSYRVMLAGAGSALDTANEALLACRKANVTAAASSDPCRPAVVDIVNLALGSIASVKRTLDSK